MSKTEWPTWLRAYQHGTFDIWPPDEVQSKINPLREKYSPIAQSFCETHITLTQPLLHPLSETDWTKLKAIVSTFKPFTIEYGPLRTWSAGRIIYFEIQPAEKVIAVRQALHETGLFNLERRHTEDYIPHMTIQEGYAEGTPDADIVEPERGMAVFETLKTTLSGGSFLCTEIAFNIPDPTFRFKVTKTLPFAIATAD